jgi:hypothetical protein
LGRRRPIRCGIPAQTSAPLAQQQACPDSGFWLRRLRAFRSILPKVFFGRATMITKDLYTYSIQILRQDSILRDHGRLGDPEMPLGPEFPDLEPSLLAQGPRGSAEW